ncbi:MAG: YadA family autotransporter adhesin [Mycobacterium sp.]
MSGAGDIAAGAHATTTVGSGAQTNGNIAIGSDTTTVSNAPSPVNTTANGGNSIAIGTGAQSTGNNSVALGAGSTDEGAANVVSVGAAGATRTITNVSAGAVSAVSTEAVNGSQLSSTNQNVTTLQTNQAADRANIATNTGSIGTNTANIATNTGNIGTLQTNQAAARATIATNTGNIGTNAATITAVVNGQAGVCTVSGGALRCSILGEPPANAAGEGAVAVGVGATANGAGAIAQGLNAQAQYESSIAIGAGAEAMADPTTALGAGAIAAAVDSTALGANSVANGVNSVALGQGSVANRANSVSVGNAATGLVRQITNVAPGTEPADAVDVGQLDGALAGVEANNDSYVNQAVAAVQNRAYQGIAAALASPTIPELAPGRKWVGLRVGEYGGESALGIAAAYQITAQANVGLMLAKSFEGGPVAVSAQFGYSW